MFDIKESILKKAKDLNIDIIGFTDGQPLLNIKDYLNSRVETNMITEFEETDIEKRIDPRLTFPDCKSIIVIGISYNVDYEMETTNIIKGNLSKSSWGLDYHKVLKEKISDLINEMKEDLDFDYKYFVDTGPLVDRELAKKAGLGYYGKNCSIINREYGSFIFLGYILTDLDIDIDDKQIEDECGECDLCIRACPTGALDQAYRLNPKKCISYLTQTKEDIVDELTSKMSTKIYGCDTCQSVCPKNKGVRKSIHKEFIPELTNGLIDIEELLNMSNRQFKEKYGSMAGSWRGKNILKRNAIIALGNMKNKKNIDLLQKEKDKNNPKLNQYIDWAINRIHNNDI